MEVGVARYKRDARIRVKTPVESSVYFACPDDEDPRTPSLTGMLEISDSKLHVFRTEPLSRPSEHGICSGYGFEATVLHPFNLVNLLRSHEDVVFGRSSVI